MFTGIMQSLSPFYEDKRPWGVKIISCLIKCLDFENEFTEFDILMNAKKSRRNAARKKRGISENVISCRILGDNLIANNPETWGSKEQINVQTETEL